MDEQVRAGELAARAVRGGYWPTLNLVAAVRDEGENLRASATLNAATQPVHDGMAWNVWGGVQVTWGLFQGLQTRSQVREADAQLVATRAERDRLVQQVWVAVQQAAASVRAAREALSAADQALTAARERLRLADGRYHAGLA